MSASSRARLSNLHILYLPCRRRRRVEPAAVRQVYVSCIRSSMLQTAAREMGPDGLRELRFEGDATEGITA